MMLKALLHHSCRTSSQDAVEPYTIIEGPAAWKASDLRQRPDEWIYCLSDQVRSRTYQLAGRFVLFISCWMLAA